MQIVQEPLQRFYDVLNDDQKHRFETMGSSGAPAKAPAGGNIAALCGQPSSDATNVPIERIAEVVQPNGDAQQSAFEALKQASRDAARALQASCPTSVPQTPMARLALDDKDPDHQRLLVRIPGSPEDIVLAKDLEGVFAFAFHP